MYFRQKKSALCPNVNFKINYQLIVMISPELHQKFQSNLAFEKHNSAHGIPNPPISQQQYTDLIVSMFEVKPFLGNQSRSLLFSSFSSFQYCGQLGLSAKTAYLAKIYLDIFFDKSTSLDPIHLPTLAFSSLSLAIHQNEPATISQHFDPTTLSLQAESSFTPYDLVAAEASMRQTLVDKLDYTTPYDYIQPFFQGFPWYTKAKIPLKSIFEIAATIYTLRNHSSADIFYGSFVAVCKLKNLVLQAHQTRILQSQMSEQDRVEAISEEITASYYQILQSESEFECQNHKQTQTD